MSFPYKSSIYSPKSLRDPIPGYFAIALHPFYCEELDLMLKAGDSGMLLGTETIKESWGRTVTNMLYKETKVKISSRHLEHFIFTPVSPALSGKSFCITGTLRWDRIVYERLITLNSGNFKSSVSKNTDYLLIGSVPGATKLNKAKACGVPTLTENDFLSKFF